MYQSRLQHVAFVAFVALSLVTACSVSPKKASSGGECNVNADCDSNTCVRNRCTEALTAQACSNEGNELLPYCQQLACGAGRPECPEGYFCSKNTCAFGTPPVCSSNAECPAATPICDKEAKGGKCLQCKVDADCKDAKDASGNPLRNCSSGNRCIAEVRTCTNNAACAGTKGADGDSTPICRTRTPNNKICVECVEKEDCSRERGGTASDWSCDANQCIDKRVTTCKGDSSCSSGKPFCNTAAEPDTCVPCNDPAIANPDERCGEEKRCETTGANAGQCVGTVGASGCMSNANCPPTGSAPSGATQWCDPETRVCGPCSGNAQCGGGTCQGGNCIRNPNPDGPCDDPIDCAVGQACNNGVCSSICSLTVADQCRSDAQEPRACIQAAGEPNPTCQAAVSCENTAQCGGGTYNGLACVGDGFCRNCTPNSADCAQAPNGRTECDNTSRLCVAPAPTNLLGLGSVCDRDNQCQSGLCLDIDRFSGGDYARLCVSACSRTETTTGDAKDCPTTVQAGVRQTAANGLPRLDPDKGFRCTLLFQPLAGNTSTRVCLHADDYKEARGDAPAADGAYQVAGGVTQGNAEMCQADLKSLSTPAVCAYRCGDTTVDCASAPGTSCTERTTTIPNSQTEATGTVTCEARPGKRPAGKTCSTANECAEGMCDGQCVSRFIPRFLANGQQQSAPCPAGDKTFDGKCYKNTQRPAADGGPDCATDADCSGSDKCIIGRCYDVLAVGGQCQDQGSCPAVGDPADQFCGGRCAKHCNASDACNDADLVANNLTVCGFRLSGYGEDRNSPVDDVWSRVCRAKTTAPDAQLRPTGDACNSDEQCATEICQAGKCAELCGNAAKCAAGTKCKVVQRRVNPGQTPVVEFSVPVCL